MTTFANMAAPLIALFLGVILAHIGLRKSLLASGVTYIEYYYFVIYIITMVVIASYFLFHNKKNLSLIQYRNGLVMKLLFWPFILTSILGITWWKFYL
ncbi:hypothetical protein [Candidatus Parabeggiatoa sp. HSG14]|uniref:hypothetical protein n=1 Tax=Candidatus Parabeggiatoa sp. HSG14 TaxID=3055593 RepID=UPI0025A7B9DF|nr:hypothetical protein [Thiotrichales bacterium HSG14]